ncbi:lipopolysaccharide biosynthesis protein [Nannocystaceae bacterium ST9]
MSEPAPASSLRRSLSWTLLGELSFAACQWISLMVVAKLGSPEALGRYSLGLAVATPVIILANLHLRPIWVVDVRDRPEHERASWADYLGLRLLVQPIALLVVALVCLIRGWPLATVTVVVAIAVIRAAGSVSDILYAPAQRAERMDPIGISRALAGVVWLAGLTIGLALGSELLALGLVALASFALTLTWDLHHARRHESMRARFEPAALRRLIRLALPMGLAAGLLGLTGNVPAYVLELDHGLAEVGFFAAVLSILQASGVVNVALGNAAIPRLAKLALADPSGFWRLLIKLLALAGLLNGLGLALVLALGEPYLRHAYTPEYAVYLPQLVLAALAAIVLGLANMLSQTLTALGQFRAQLWINLAALLGSLGLSLWLIPGRGIEGAVWALLGLAILRLVLYVIANFVFGPRARAPSPKAAR